MKAKVKLKDLAAHINAHLKRMENDPKINKVTEYGRAGNSMRLKRFYQAGCGASGPWVHVTYVSYQGSANLSKADATAYLAWLDAGGNGEHYLAEVKP